jgi:hypothetical protein
MTPDKPDNRPAWSLQLGESAESFADFVVYRDLGPYRSLAEVQRLKGKPKKGRKKATVKRQASGCMKRRSKRWKWGDRVAAWDAMLDAKRTATIVAAVRKQAQALGARWGTP